MITLQNKMINKIGLKSFKPLLVFFAFFFVLIILPNSAKAGQDVINYNEFPCVRHGHGDYKNCGMITTLFSQNRNDYASAHLDYQFLGHRHGSSLEIGSVCLMGSNGEGMCQPYSCSDESCGYEYGGVHPHNPQYVGSMNLSSASPGTGSNFWVTRASQVTDAELWIAISADAFYPDAPPPPPTTGSPPGAFTLNSTYCSGGGSIVLSWSPSSGADSYRIERKTWTGGSWGSLGTVNGTSYNDSNITLGADYYYRIYAVNGDGETRSNPSSDNAIGGSCAAPGTEGICGTANRTYPAGTSSYGSETYCEAGSPSATPAFPASGTSVNWTCLGSGGAPNSSQCTATLTGGVPPPATYQAGGYIDTNNPYGSQNCTIIQGWAWDPDYPNNATTVHVYKDGVFDGYALANLARPDLPGNTEHAFNYLIPNSWKDGLNHNINVYAIDLNGNGNPNLGFSPISNLNCAPVPPTLNSVSISAPTVVADNTTKYDIVISSSESSGAGNIKDAYALINYQGSNGDQTSAKGRGYLTWANIDKWPGAPERKVCSLNGTAGTGGYAVIQPGVFGSQYIHLDSCSVVDSGYTRDVYFKVRFDPSYVAPATNNDISGYVCSTNTACVGWTNFDINFAVTGVITSNATISSPTINPNNVTQYTITVNGIDLNSGSNISHLFALINYQGSNAGSYRGHPTWYFDDTYTGWDPQSKDKRFCTGGGIGVIQNTYGSGYMSLDSCSVSVSGNTRTAVFTVRFSPLFAVDGPLTNNDISSFAYNIYNIYGWTNNNINFGILAPSAPVSPTITGPTTGIPSTNYTYGFTSTDPQGYQVRYGIDWNMDSVADEWLPGGLGYVNSGTSQNTSHSWSTTGVKNFQALAQSTFGLNSAWRPYSITISSAPVNGVCGTANKSYPSGSISYGLDTYCALGNPSATPAFPAPGTSVNWTCLGISGGTNSPQCTASVAASTFLLTVSANPGPGGTVESTDGNIDCGTTCSASYTAGSIVTLKAIPTSSYWKFTGWSGGGCSGTGACVVNVSGNTLISATFVPRPFILIEF